MCIFPKLQSVMLPFTYVCFWKCYTSIKALFFLFTKFHNTKLRTVPHGTVRKVRLVRIFITRTNVPYPYLSNNYVPYKRTVLLAEKWSVPYRTCVPYRTVRLYGSRNMPCCSSAEKKLIKLKNRATVYSLC